MRPFARRRAQTAFPDDFSGNEATLGKEDIGNGWTSNSAWRAKGHQQVDPKDGIDFVDRDLETDHADHLRMTRVTNKNLQTTDSKTGGMDNKISERLQASCKSPELAALLKTEAFKLVLSPNDRHTLQITVSGD